jgi:receptor-type tyrosine-protein phosphatase F
VHSSVLTAAVNTITVESSVVSAEPLPTESLDSGPELSTPADQPVQVETDAEPLQNAASVSVASTAMVAPESAERDSSPEKGSSVAASGTGLSQLDAKAADEADSDSEPEDAVDPDDPVQMLCRPVPISQIAERIRELSAGMPEFEALERLALRQRQPRDVDYLHALAPANFNKNRYRNVLALDSTRVELPPDEDRGDYINANWISGTFDDQPHRFIATQGPLDETAADFWRMVWRYRVGVIVMLAKQIEGNRVKCSTYWPGLVSNYARYSFRGPEEGFTVELELKSTEKNPLSGAVLRQFLMTRLDTGEERSIMHFQHVDWPDHGIPETTDEFLELEAETTQANLAVASQNLGKLSDELRAQLSSGTQVDAERPPIVVHCSAGIGRTGSYVLIENVLERLEHDLRRRPNREPRVNLVNEFLRLRRQRDGMVQTEEQYLFCWKAVAHAVERNPLAARFLNSAPPSSNSEASANESPVEKDGASP